MEEITSKSSEAVEIIHKIYVRTKIKELKKKKKEKERKQITKENLNFTNNISDPFSNSYFSVNVSNRQTDGQMNSLNHRKASLQKNFILVSIALTVDEFLNCTIATIFILKQLK